MKPFHAIARPHEDIVRGKLELDLFAPNLWEVYNARGPEEYRNPEVFFRKTYITKGLDTLLQVVEKKIKGEGGDSVLLLQTPFGGGKTHSLIALFHKAREWNANTIVFVGDELSPPDTIIWEEFERQLAGKVEKLRGPIVPSGEKIRQLLREHQPVIILMDELIEYLIPARGIKIENSTFDSQVLSFIKRLTEVVSSLDRTILLVTTPSRAHYSTDDQHLLDMLLERLGRKEKSLAPVHDEEIAHIIRKRLFFSMDEEEMKKVVNEVVTYFKNEGILPESVEPSEYREQFMKTYPFLPDVINCLYHRWGSFPTFQKTRGMLRILALTLRDLMTKNLSYISLADIDLNNDEIRRELLKHLGNEYESVIVDDIVGVRSGAKIVDSSMGASYEGLHLGTRTATAIFLHSHSGDETKGATFKDMKRSASLKSIPSSVISEVIVQLKSKLFHLHHINGKLLFTSQPNMNKLVLTKMENIEDEQILELERQLLKTFVGKHSHLKTFIWPDNSNVIPDNQELKLVILRGKDESVIREFIENKGTKKRIYRNTLLFVVPLEPSYQNFLFSLKKVIALQSIESDKTLVLSSDQKQQVNEQLKREKDEIKHLIRDAYRIVLVPQSLDHLDEVDLGISTHGSEIDIPRDVHDKLVEEGYIIDKIAPLVLKERFLKNDEVALTKNIYESSLKVLGEDRFSSKDALVECICNGVKTGLFGLGEIENDEIVPIYWKQDPVVSFSDNEALISARICQEKLQAAMVPSVEKKMPRLETTRHERGEMMKESLVLEKDAEESGAGIAMQKKEELILPPLTIPIGKVSNLLGLLNFLQGVSNELQVQIILKEADLSMSTTILDGIREFLRELDMADDAIERFIETLKQ